jgi:YegS/Rv2252/BmrU family lipid kinase
MKILYVVNPAAGRARAPGMRDEVHDVARRAGFGGDVVFTERQGHATEIARSAAAARYDVVVSVGGDGTANEVADGILGTETALAVVPAGSGNDFAAELGLPRRWRDALVTLPSATRRRIDVGRANGQLFLQTAGIGADAYIAQLRDQERLLSGPAAYAKCAVQGLLTVRPTNVEIGLNGRRWTQRALAVTVANGERYGGGLKIAPGARLDDGLLDVVVVGDMGVLEALRVFPTVYWGRHLGHPKIGLERGDRLSVRTVDGTRPLPVHTDGTRRGVTPVEFTVERAALEVFSLRRSATHLDTGESAHYDGPHAQR